MRPVAATFVLWLAIGLVASAGTAVACGNGKLIHESKFNSEDSAWTILSGESYKATVGSDGLTSKVPPGSDVSGKNDSSRYKNFETCAVFSIKSEGKWDFFALRFWMIALDDAYWVVTWPNSGAFIVNHYKDHKVVHVTSQLNEPSLVNSGGTNEVSVSVSGDRGTFSVNGKKVADFTGTPPEGGSIIGFVMHADEGNSGPSIFTLKSIQLREVSPGH